MSNENNELPAKNRGGRPKGSRDTRSRTDRLITRLANSRGDNLERIVDTVCKLAEDGEAWAAQAVLGRMWPVPKGRTIKGLTLPVGLGADAIAAAFDQVVAAVNRSDITPAEALELGSLLKMQLEALEAKDIAKRLAALEGNADAA